MLYFAQTRKQQTFHTTLSEQGPLFSPFYFIMNDAQLRAFTHLGYDMSIILHNHVLFCTMPILSLCLMWYIMYIYLI